ncbi:MAG: K(+)-transporting ATPase subunit F [Victivallaceae bacterium]
MIYIVTIATIFCFGYLVYALIWPEKF